MKTNAKTVLAMTLIVASLYSTHASATDCIEEGRKAELEHIQTNVELYQDQLNSDDVAVLKQEAALLGRMVARTCFMIEQKK